MLLGQAERAARQDGICVHGLVAEVEEDNEACARCLSKAGFFEAGPAFSGLRTFTRQIARS